MEVSTREHLLARNVITTAEWSATVTLMKADSGKHRVVVFCPEISEIDMEDTTLDTLDAWRTYITICDFLREQG